MGDSAAHAHCCAIGTGGSSHSAAHSSRQPGGRSRARSTRSPECTNPHSTHLRVNPINRTYRDFLSTTIAACLSPHTAHQQKKQRRQTPLLPLAPQDKHSDGGSAAAQVLAAVTPSSAGGVSAVSAAVAGAACARSRRCAAAGRSSVAATAVAAAAPPIRHAAQVSPQRQLQICLSPAPAPA